MALTDPIVCEGDDGSFFGDVLVDAIAMKLTLAGPSVQVLSNGPNANRLMHVGWVALGKRGVILPFDPQTDWWKYLEMTQEETRFAVPIACNRVFWHVLPGSQITVVVSFT